MKRISILSVLLLSIMLIACTGKSPEVPLLTVTMAGKTEGEEQRAAIEKKEGAAAAESEVQNEEVMLIQVQGNGHTVVFELNDSAASRSLYNQLPFRIEVENYSSNEKIFYPPEKLEIGETPLTDGGEEGGLAYFASWGNVIMYYGNFGPYSGLYELGTATSGSQWIRELSGELLISVGNEAGEP